MMKRFALLILLVLLLISVSTGSGKPSECAVKGLLLRIHSVLPRGWTVTYDQENAWLTVSRVKPVVLESSLMNLSADELPEVRQCEFSFRIVDAPDPKEYELQRTENEAITREVDTLFKKLEAQKVSRKFDEFRPVKAEDKSLVERYEKLRASKHQLVDYTYGLIGLLTDLPIWSVDDREVRRECTKTKGLVYAILSPRGNNP